jgi:hypothetical protein
MNVVINWFMVISFNSGMTVLPVPYPNQPACLHAAETSLQTDAPFTARGATFLCVPAAQPEGKKS